MVRLRNIEPLTVAAVELAFRYAHGAPELDLKEWLEMLPDAGSRLRAIGRLLSDDQLDKTCSAREQQQALLVARAVLRTVMLLCRDREKSLDEMVAELMEGSPIAAGP